MEILDSLLHVLIWNETLCANLYDKTWMSASASVTEKLFHCWEAKKGRVLSSITTALSLFFLLAKLFPAMCSAACVILEVRSFSQTRNTAEEKQLGSLSGNVVESLSTSLVYAKSPLSPYSSISFINTIAQILLYPFAFKINFCPEWFLFLKKKSCCISRKLNL